MSSELRIVNVDASNVDREGFFCYKSKQKTPGYSRKLAWSKNRFSEGMKLDILYDGKRSFGFIEYIPGEYSWRAVYAPDYTVIHCIWMVGSGKGKGFASQLLEGCIEVARKEGRAGVVMVTSNRPFLAGPKLFLKHGFTQVDSAPPHFQLMALKLRDAPNPYFPVDWDKRLEALGSGLTVVRTDQCPYWDEATDITVETARTCGIRCRVVEFTSATEAREKSPTPFGTFGIVEDGQLLGYHYLSPKELAPLLGGQAT
ncbi:MAG: GNAT family N-acetyltransferase [Chloroflexi bacterium]|nr:GNAT family N-acetyltransferase [Chloroflexota bacterium]